MKTNGTNRELDDAGTRNTIHVPSCISLSRQQQKFLSKLDLGMIGFGMAEDFKQF